MKIEMVVAALDMGGLETAVARMTRQLVMRGHHVGITCIQAGGAVADQLRAEGIRVVVVPLPGKRTIAFPRRLTEWFRSIAPDVVHIHSGAWLKAARAAAAAAVPRVIHTEHGVEGNEPFYGSLLKRWAARETDLVVPVSKALMTYLAQTVGLPYDKMHVVENGVDTDEFAPSAHSGLIRRRFGLSDDRIVIGHVARLAPVKNHAMLIDAFALARERDARLFLAIVGDGPVRAELESRISACGLDADVGMYGPTDDLPPVYADFDMFALSSFAEGTSISVLEAMATGVPVIATAVGGTPPLLDHGLCGVLIESGDTNALAQVMLRLASDRALRQDMAARARKRAVEHYSESAVVDAYEALYRGNTPTNRVVREAAPLCAV